MKAKLLTLTSILVILVTLSCKKTDNPTDSGNNLPTTPISITLSDFQAFFNTTSQLVTKVDTLYPYTPGFFKLFYNAGGGPYSFDFSTMHFVDIGMDSLLTASSFSAIPPHFSGNPFVLYNDFSVFGNRAYMWGAKETSWIFTFGTNVLLKQGEVRFPPAGAEIHSHYLPADTVFNFPIDYNTFKQNMNSSQYDSTGNTSNSNYTRSTGWQINAWGVMKLPGGRSVECLRITQLVYVGPNFNYWIYFLSKEGDLVIFVNANNQNLIPDSELPLYANNPLYIKF